MITDNDIQKLKTVFATKNEVEAIADNVNEKLVQFRSDIFNKLDQVIGELKTNREEREVIAHKVSDHEDRLNIVEVTLKLSSE